MGHKAFDLSRVTKAARVGCFAWTIATNELRWSDELCRMHGLEPSQFGGTLSAFIDLVYPDDQEFVNTMVEELLAQPGPFRYDHRIVRADGAVRTIHSQGEVESDASGRATQFIGACWDVTDPAAVREDLEHSLSLLRATLDAIREGVLVVDRNQKVVTCNRQFFDMWRIPPELDEEQNDTILLEHVESQIRQPAEFRRKVRELYEHPEAESFDLIDLTEHRHFERSSRPQCVGDEIVGRVWTFHDVTDRENALAAREILLAVAAHELRGPLMSVLLAVQSLQHKGLRSDQVAKALEIANREALRLSRFVDQLLDVGRLWSGHIQIDLEAVPLADVVEEVAATMTHEIAASGSQLTIHADDRPVVAADRSRLSQIVGNLLSNAIKFGRGRPIEVEIQGGQGRATLAVRDHGMGMAEDEMKGIFDAFERRVSDRQYGGLGLGLFIVKRLTSAMHGRIWITSRKGQGSTFTVELPEEGT